MFSIRRIAAPALALFVVASSYASSVVGVWHGHADFSGLKPSAGTDAKQVEMIKKLLGTMKLTIDFKANKTCNLTAEGGMMKTPQKDSGTWTQAGNTVNVTNKKDTQALIMSPNGHTMVMTPKGANGVKFVFTR